jgi:hypothetical protein
MTDVQFNEVDSNNLESVGSKGKTKKIAKSSLTYPQKRVFGTQTKVETKNGSLKSVKIKNSIKK